MFRLLCNNSHSASSLLLDLHWFFSLVIFLVDSQWNLHWNYLCLWGISLYEDRDEVHSSSFQVRCIDSWVIYRSHTLFVYSSHLLVQFC